MKAKLNKPFSDIFQDEKGQILDRLADVVSGARHKHYKETVEYAKQTKTLTTGKGLDEYLAIFSARETPVQFAVRKSITRHIIKSVVSNLIDTAARVDRVRSTRTLEYLNNEPTAEIERKESVLKQRTEAFFGDSSVYDYVKKKVRHYAFYDPNAWLVLDFKPFDNRTDYAKPYPIEYRSKYVYDYSYSYDNILQYVTVCEKIELSNGQEGEKYTVFGKEQHLQLIQLSDDFPISKQLDTVQEIGDSVFLTLNNKVYQLIETEPHGLGYVPALRFGYEENTSTNLETFKCFYDGAVDILMKTIKLNSELDVVLAQMAHPYVVRYLVQSDAADEQRELDIASDISDIRDLLASSMKRQNALPSVLEETVITIPENAQASDIIDPNKLIAFINPPLEAINALDKMVQDLIRRAKEVVFNSDMYTKKDIAETATKQNLSAQAMNDKLYPLARHIAETVEFVVRSIARLTDTDGGLVFEMSYSEDLKLKGADAILSDLVALKEANAPAEVVDIVTAQLMDTLLDDQPNKQLEYAVKKMLNPLSSKSPEERILALTSEFFPNWAKAAYFNFDIIFSELLQEQPDFFAFAEGQQKQLFKAKAETYVNTPNEPVIQ